MTPSGPPVHQDPDHRQAVASGAALAFLGRLGALLEAISQPVFAWVYGPVTFGLYATLWALVKILTSLTECAMTTTLQRTVPAQQDEDAAHQAVGLALLVSAGLGTLAALLITALAPLLATILNAGADDADHLVAIIRLYAWVLPFWTLVEVLTAAVRARRRFGPEIRVRIFYEQGLRLLAAVGFAGLGWLSFGLFLAHLVSVVLAAGLALQLLARNYDLRLVWQACLDRSMARQMLSFALPMAPATLMKRLNSELPVLLLNIIVPGANGAAAAGFYAVARKIASVLQVVRVSFEYVLAPLAAHRKGLEDSDGLQDMFAFATRLTLCLALPLAAALYGARLDILQVFSPEFTAVAAPLAILVLGRLLEAAGGPATAVIEMIGHRFLPVINGLAGLAILLMLFAPLHDLFGLAGAAMAAAIGYNVTSLLGLLQVRLAYGLAPLDHQAVRPLAISTATAIGIWACTTAIPGHFVGASFAMAVVGLLVSLPLIVRYGLSDRDAKALGPWARRLHRAVT